VSKEATNKASVEHTASVTREATRDGEGVGEATASVTIAEVKKELGLDDETAKGDADETTGLLSGEGDEGSGGKERHGPGPLPGQAKEYALKTELKVDGSYLVTGDLNNPQHLDYKISWNLYKLPTTPDGKVCDHTVLAEQTKTKSGGYSLKAHIPDGVSEFHLDQCCGYVCCLGYNVVQDEKYGGYGCIAKMDACCFPNASSDENRDGDVEQGYNDGDNTRKVEKFAEGQRSVDDLIQGMAEANADKTKFYRYFGFFLMFLGFQFVMDPIPTVFHFIPFIGTAIGAVLYVAVFIVALALGCFGSITTISIAWVRYRPCLGIFAILCITAVAVGICMLPPLNTLV